MLELKEIKKDYPAGGDVVHALKGIDLKFRKNEFVSILGQSGCGKTTMLNIIGGLDHYTSGDLVINGRSTKDFKDRDRDAYRNHSFGFVFQSYNLIPHLTAEENVLFPFRADGRDVAPTLEKMRELCAELCILQQLGQYPDSLSGGQQQRFSIARALAKNPKLLLCDEPTGALDYKTGKNILKLLQDTGRKTGMTVIIITHNAALTAMADRVIRVKNGTVVSETINENPQNISEIEW